MTTTAKKANAIIPNYPRGTQVVTQDGRFTPAWHQTFGSLFQALQRNWKSEGFQMPTLNQDDINRIQASYVPFIGTSLPQTVPNISGQIVYDTTNNVPKVFVITFAGNNVLTASWKTFTIT